jgi:hypothetical protein
MMDLVRAAGLALRPLNAPGRELAILAREWEEWMAEARNLELIRP